MPNIISGKRPSNTAREKNYDGLVSMQTEGEWVYFKNITAIIAQEQKEALKRRRWFIGLRYFSHKWCWSSDTKACIKQTTDGIGNIGNWRWNAGEPNNLLTAHCVEMFQGGRYNNINCRIRFSDIGLIREKEVGM